MGPEPSAEKEMREIYAALATETLLEQLTSEADTFEPRALELMEEELARRGVDRAEIDKQRRGLDLLAPHGGRIPGSGQLPDDLVPVGQFEDALFAEQARGLLDRAGIDCVLKGEDFTFPGTMLQGLTSPSGLTLLVLEGQAQEARRILEGFEPAGERGDAPEPL